MYTTQLNPYRVKLDHFEGPLDLLLYLIKKNELDICEVSLTRIADQYLQTVQSMDLLDLEVAGEFILVASTLMLLKSRALLPDETQNLGEEDEDALESPQELITRLLQYKKYKEAALEMRKMNTLHHQVFLRQVEHQFNFPERKVEGPLEVDLFDLFQAFQRVLERVSEEKPHAVDRERLPLPLRIRQLVDQLKKQKDFLFEDFFTEARTRDDIIVTFLALLELAKIAIVTLYQNDPFSGIHVQSRFDENPPLDRLNQILENPAATTAPEGDERGEEIYAN